MKESFFEAYTYGIGQLITQRKMFVVPEHQRNFAWTITDVEVFIDDITSAMKNNAPDYFIGLIVLLGPEDNKWIILDGQQRLVTTTMIYAAVREWLWKRGFELDSNQIENEFIAVRALGEEFIPRFTPNITNRDVFIKTVVEKCPEEDIRVILENTPRYSSNRLLLEANLVCRKKVNDFVSETSSNENDQTSSLYKLANYLESRVRVVAMDVSSEANAYTIFESLNARGNELAVVDLVKNFIFGNADADKLHIVQDQWQNMSEILEDKNLDDYLKVFWTSQFGRIQTSQLYSQIKSRFPSSESAEYLVSELLNKAESFIALDYPGHDIWKKYGSKTQKYIHTLVTLGNRQVRAPILASIDNLNKEELETLIWGLIVLTVRHQIVGRRRTGMLEIYCANLANQLQLKKIGSKESICNSINNFIPSDLEFVDDFTRFYEVKRSREMYFHSELENMKRVSEGEKEIEIDSSEYEIVYIFSREEIKEDNVHPISDDDVEECYRMIANRTIIEKDLNAKGGKSSFGESKLLNANDIHMVYSANAIQAILDRKINLAGLASKRWRVESK